MDVRPILSTLSRHKTAAAVIVLEVALTCAIICNAMFLAAQRLGNLDQPSGIAENQLLQIQLSAVGPQVNADARTQEDLSALRQISGVANVTVVNQLPFYGSGFDTDIRLSREEELHALLAAQYMGSDGLVQTLGLSLLAGRDFVATEYQDLSEAMALASSGKLQMPVIINSAMARKLFPGGDALGHTVYTANIALNIVGIVDTLAYPYPPSEKRTYSLILPLHLDYTEGFYMIRVKNPADRNAVLASAVDALEKIDPSRLVLHQRSYEEIRNDEFRSDRYMVWVSVAVCVGLLLITAVGIIGLASFWVAQRTRQIGIRRALGATKVDVLRYFQTENFLLSTAGIVIGVLLAYTLNQWLMARYELARLPALFLPVGALLMWLLGQLAVLWPARRAAEVSPAVATRDA